MRKNGEAVILNKIPEEEMAIMGFADWFVFKSAKQREESAKIYKENSRYDLYDNEIAELDVLKSFLPKMLNAEETERVVRSVIETVGASSMKDMGKVMSELNANYAGQVDRGEVSKLVKAILSK